MMEPAGVTTWASGLVEETMVEGPGLDQIRAIWTTTMMRMMIQAMRRGELPLNPFSPLF